MKNSFTLLELLVTMVIIAILAGIALPQFGKTKERALTKEAIANLKLIAAAEKIYRMEGDDYYPMPAGSSESDVSGVDCLTDGNINDCLRLSLTEGSWDYVITSPGAGGGFTSTAQRKSGQYSSCQYSINQNQDEPVPVVPANCP